jgi:DNA polymerase-3 subunit epsilon
MEFTAIDFETANESPNSACQLGVVRVVGGEVVERRCWLIRPRPFRFTAGNIAIHGIPPQRVEGEPEFGQLWPEIWDVLGGQILVAHNARFDIGVLRACLLEHRQGIPEIEYTCTRNIARAAWPGEYGYGLRAIADRLGITFRHHDALEDAEACAEVLVQAALLHRATSLGELERKLRISRGRAGAWGYGGARTVGDSGASRYGGSSYRTKRRGTVYPAKAMMVQQLLRLRGSADEGEGYEVGKISVWRANAQAKRPLCGEVVVVTGLMTSMEREEAEGLVVLAGGACGKSVTQQTTMLVVGSPDARTLRAGRQKSTKQIKAETLQASGQRLRILNERQFLEMFQHAIEE